jgi:hypothetical protein
MEFRRLTPGEVLQREKAPSKTVDRRQQLRANSLACYTPHGSAQASRRITGSHLDPDSPEMEQAALLFAESLVDALREGRGMFRSLIGPARYSDRILTLYVQRLFKGAMGKPSPNVDHPISPLLVQYLLGGVPWKNVEQLCYRALEVTDFMPDPMPASTLGAVVSPLGFGAHIKHLHENHRLKFDLDNTPYKVEIDKVHNHLSFRQDYLLGLPKTGSYASILIRDGAYGDGLRRQLASWMDDIIATAERLLDPQGGEMSEGVAEGRFGQQPRLPVTLDDGNYKRAIRRVFEQDWDQLDLLCGGPEDRVAEGEVLMARLIIQRLAYAPQMTPEQLIGMSLLTGISLANWTAFAVKDRERRGETFLTADTIEQVIEVCDYQAGYDCGQELRSDMIALDRMDRDAHGAAKKRWARRVQSSTNPLWSTNGLYYQIAETSDNIPICKPKPFSPSGSWKDD